MSKRDTIIISVLVNAGILVVLFFTAVTSRDEVIGGATAAIASQMFEEEKSPIVTPEKEPLAAVASIEDKSAIQLPKVEEKNDIMLPILEKEVVHKLPEVAKEEKPVVVKEEEKNEFLDHIVKSGESLEKIARKYQIRVADLKEMNHLKDNFLKIGQKLVVKHGQTRKLELKIDNDGEYYLVKTGDSPWTIAMKNHIKVDDLLRLNDLNEQKARKLKPGDKLRIR